MILGQLSTKKHISVHSNSIRQVRRDKSGAQPLYLTSRRGRPLQEPLVLPYNYYE